MISSKKSPDKSDRLPASNPSMQTLDLLMMRRSLTVKDMRDPGPSEEQLNQLLTIGSRVPDHKKQVPWRFLTFAGTARKDIGKILRKYNVPIYMSSFANKRYNLRSLSCINSLGKTLGLTDQQIIKGNEKLISILKNK